MIAGVIVASLIFSAFIALAAWCAESLLRTIGKQTRAVWLLALPLCLVWSLAAPRFFTTAGTPTFVPIVVQSPTAVAAPPIESTAAESEPVRSVSTEALLIGGWLVLSGLAVARLASAFFQLRRVRSVSSPAIVDGTAVLLTDDVGPGVACGKHGDIFIPRWLLDFEQPLRALVFRHELEHRSARDPLMLWVSFIATALVPWNVPVWWIARRLRLSLEIDCDSRTLAASGDRDRYARLLLMIAQHEPRMPLASTLSGSRSALSTRIAVMMLDHARTSRAKVVASFAVASLAIGAACSTRIAGNLTSPSPVADQSASTATAFASAESLSAVSMNAAAAARDPYFDFQVDRPAQLKASPSAEYPAELRAAGVEGQVVVQVVVDQQGRPDMSTFRIVRSTNAAFNEPVMRSMRSALFTPAEVDGLPVRQLVQLPFAFGMSFESATRSGIDNAGGKRVGTRQMMDDTIARRRSMKATTTTPANPDTPYFDFQVEKPAQMRADSKVFPAYPPGLRATSKEGTVLAQFVIDEDGVVDMSTFKVLRSNDPAFEESVRQALPRILWTPAEVGGRRVRQLVQQPFGFSLNK